MESALKLKIITLTLFAMLLACAEVASAEATTYALQMGQFASKSEAESLMQASTARGYPAKVIAAQDSSKNRVWVVAVGKYASPEQARGERARLSSTWGVPSSAPVIVLPPDDLDKARGEPSPLR